MKLYPHQQEAVEKLKTGSILQGGVGSGKTLTSLAYFLKNESNKDLYVITTARKRDSLDWTKEAIALGIFELKVDSWNNIHKYVGVHNAFFIFDEQRLVGSGAWVKSFLKIVKSNNWILLSATPGDKWMDYVPVFLANGFYRNRTDFIQQHVVFKRFAKFPLIDYYINIQKLIRLRDDILCTMKFERQTVQHHIDVICKYDKEKYNRVAKNRWNEESGVPITNAAELCYMLRHICNEDFDRIIQLDDIYLKKKKVIVFYNFNYELNMIEEYCQTRNIPYSQWNGHKHEEIPQTNTWLYLVQYTAGAEAWNCIDTNCIVFFSQNYSYKIMVQSAGRIDRLNTEFTDLYYYHLSSQSPIDIAIARCLREKKDFNESIFAGL